MVKIKASYGYIGMTLDFLHIGHILALIKCKEHCERLIVGIMSDKCVEKYKGKRPVMDWVERGKLIASSSLIYKIWMQDSFEFPSYLFKFKDLYGDDFLIFDSDEHKREGADIIIPYTEGISSSMKKAGL